MMGRYEFECDTCGTLGTADDGIWHGAECPDEECDGTIHRIEIQKTNQRKG